MKTFRRICIKQTTFEDEPTEVTLERGKEYLTSGVDDDGNVVVFTSYWFRAPVGIFAGAEPGSGPGVFGSTEKEENNKKDKKP